jgi:hypothetical protein
MILLKGDTKHKQHEGINYTTSFPSSMKATTVKTVFDLTIFIGWLLR